MDLLRLDDDGDTSTVSLTPSDEETSWSLGRGPLLKLTDLKLSRNQATISFENGHFVFKTPKASFFKGHSEDEFRPVAKGEAIRLSSDDQFGLMADKYVYKVRVKEACEENGDVRTDDNDDGVENKENEVKGEPSKNKENEVKGEPVKRKKKEVNGMTKERVLPDWMTTGVSPKKASVKSPAKTPMKVSAKSPKKKSPSPKKDKIHQLSDDEELPSTSSKEKALSSSEDEAMKSPAVTPKKKLRTPKKISPKRETPMKLEMSDDEDEPPKKVVKENSFPTLITASDLEDSEDLLTAGPSNKADEKREEKEKKEPKRKRCPYGAMCYRKNPQHKIDESHPGDSDYEEEEEDDEDDERPECEFGTDCYRKNPQHRKDFKHTKKPRPKRKAKAKAMKKNKKGGHASGDEDSYDGSFIDDDEDEDIDISDDEEDIEEWVPSSQDD